MPLSPEVAVILARLDAMDTARELERDVQREWRASLDRRLDGIHEQVKATNGRVTALERDEAEQKGERAGRSGVGKIVAASAAGAAAATAVVFQIIDHL